jgi:hypothetical protein
MTNLIDQINKVVGAESDSDLSRKLSEIAEKPIDRRIISRWRRFGFHDSTEALVRLLIKRKEGK